MVLFLIVLTTVISVIIVLNRTSSDKPAVENASPLFGAIARSASTGKIGYSAKSASRTEAEQAAVSTCGKDCAVISWFQNACGAYAEGAKSWGSNFGGTADEAARKASETCGAQSSDPQCTAKLIVCADGLVSKK